jgi:hypothetical protein
MPKEKNNVRMKGGVWLKLIMQTTKLALDKVKFFGFFL